MDIVCVNKGMLGSNVYVLSDRGECVVIDAGAMVEDILPHIQRSGCKLKYIVLTHGHGDHIASVNELREATGALVVAHKEEEKLLLEPEYNCSYEICNRLITIKPDILVEEGDEISFGDTVLSFLYTPGHTRGSMCIQCESNLFTGDTLFCGSVGRTDLPTGDIESLEDSINKFRMISDRCVVYPGHGELTTMGDEKINNVWFR